jgi:hypothetical protein
MMTPCEIKFELEKRLLKLTQDGGRVPVITGLHSIVVEGDTVNVGFDLLTCEAESSLLFFEFERPREVGRDELTEFSTWLAQTGHWGHTLH